jgi:hypothetical protein
MAQDRRKNCAQKKNTRKNSDKFKKTFHEKPFGEFNMAVIPVLALSFPRKRESPPNNVGGSVQRIVANIFRSPIKTFGDDKKRHFNSRISSISTAALSGRLDIPMAERA